MLEGYLVQTCKLVAPTRDEYGDYIDGTGTELPCRFREINTIVRGTRNELNDSDAMIWFAPGAPVAKGNIILFEGVNYQIERINKARRLGESEVQFIKCDLKVTDIGIS